MFMLAVATRLSWLPVLNIAHCGIVADLGLVCLFKCVMEDLSPSLRCHKASAFLRRRKLPIDMLLIRPSSSFSVCTHE